MRKFSSQKLLPEVAGQVPRNSSFRNRGPIATLAIALCCLLFVGAASAQSPQNQNSQSSSSGSGAGYGAAPAEPGAQPVYPGEPFNKEPVQLTAGPVKIRVYGTVLLNVSVNDTDQLGQDVPLWPFPSSAPPVTFPDGTSKPVGQIHDTIFTARQSVFGFTINPANWNDSGWNASALVEFDLFGNRPIDSLVPEDRVLNQPRLRKAYLQLQHGHFKLIAGQDNIIISPMDPVSLSHVAYPLGYAAGNLFGWLPQVRVEYDQPLGGDTSLLYQFGVLRPDFGDPRLGDQPPVGITVDSFSGFGERASQPFYQGRVAVSHPIHGRKATLGVGGHYGQERVGANLTRDSWAATFDLSVPIFSRLILRAEGYAGSNLVPFGGGILQGIAATPGAPPFTQLQKIGDWGGWPELTFIATPKDIFYVGASTDEPVHHDLLPGTTRERNSVFWASYFRKLTPGVTVALEYSNWDFHTTTFTGITPGANGAVGRGNVVNIAFAYQF